MTRVLFLIGSLGPGGAERQARLLLTGLAATEGVSVRLGCFGGYEDELERVRRAGIEIDLLEPRPRGLWPFRLALQIGAITRRHRIGWIQTFLPTFDLLAPLFRIAAPGAHVATSRRSLDEYLRPREVRLLRWTGGAAHAIVVNSRAVAESVERLEGHRSPQVRVIPNGIELPPPFEPRERSEARARLGLGPTETAILYLAHFRRGKGHRFLPELMEALAARAPEAKLLLAGDTEVNASYRRLAAETSEAFRARGVTVRVLPLGNVRDPRGAFAAADIFLSLSESEGSPNSVLEAMAHGLPVVATEVGGTLEAIRSGEDGCLVPPGEIEPAVAAIAALAGDHSRRARLGEAARARIERDYSVEKMVRRYVDLYSGRPADR